MNLHNYELYVKESKCEHGVKADVVISIGNESSSLTKKSYKYSAIYNCSSNCAKFFLYPNIHPSQSSDLSRVSSNRL